MKGVLRGLPALVLALALACTGCAAPKDGEDFRGEGDCPVYFVSARPGDGVRPLEWEGRSLPEGTSDEVTGLLELLLAGPRSEALTSPFPQDTALLGWELAEGRLRVDLSEAYGGLSGVELTLADGCVVLTLCGLEGVREVYITVEGRPRPFRDQVLTPRDFLFDETVSRKEK